MKKKLATAAKIFERGMYLIAAIAGSYGLLVYISESSDRALQREALNTQLFISCSDFISNYRLSDDAESWVVEQVGEHEWENSTTLRTTNIAQTISPGELHKSVLNACREHLPQTVARRVSQTVTFPTEEAAEAARNRMENE